MFQLRINNKRMQQYSRSEQTYREKTGLDACKVDK